MWSSVTLELGNSVFVRFFTVGLVEGYKWLGGTHAWNFQITFTRRVSRSSTGERVICGPTLFSCPTFLLRCVPNFIADRPSLLFPWSTAVPMSKFFGARELFFQSEQTKRFLILSPSASNFNKKTHRIFIWGEIVYPEQAPTDDLRAPTLLFTYFSSQHLYAVDT